MPEPSFPPRTRIPATTGALWRVENRGQQRRQTCAEHLLARDLRLPEARALLGLPSTGRSSELMSTNAPDSISPATRSVRTGSTPPRPPSFEATSTRARGQTHGERRGGCDSWPPGPGSTRSSPPSPQSPLFPNPAALHPPRTDQDPGNRPRHIQPAYPRTRATLRTTLRPSSATARTPRTDGVPTQPRLSSAIVRLAIWDSPRALG